MEQKLLCSKFAMFNHLLGNLLPPWSTVLFEKLTGSQLVKNFPAFYGTRRFITAFTSARHMSLSWARSVQSMPPRHPTSWRFLLMLSAHLRPGLPSVFLGYKKFELQGHISSFRAFVSMVVRFRKCNMHYVADKCKAHVCEKYRRHPPSVH